ncbi:MAG TPA: putative glycolipid-binding domain-containing protein [Thermoanaerobaculia bacterium]|nr:putative glycolipid-binding domain-containing protein [Thermoanaerobaculia bacterium]
MMPPRTAAVLWRRIDRPGHESARLIALEAGWELAGTSVFAHEGEACRLSYRIVCDPEWRTRSVEVDGWLGPKEARVDARVERTGEWLAGGIDLPEISGCVDVDLNFSPSTNLLPIRRLNLAVGEEKTVRAAWLRFPSFRFEPLEQSYRRLSRERYRYRSAGGRFETELEVDESGFVTRYPGFWEMKP